jgi:hypothetical protein
MKGGVSTSSVDTDKLENRIVELEKEVIALKGELAVKEAENKGLKDVNKLLLDMHKSSSELKNEIDKLLGLNNKDKTKK